MSEDTGYPYGNDKQPVAANGGGWWDLFHRQGVTYDLLSLNAGGGSFRNLDRAFGALRGRRKYVAYLRDIGAAGTPESQPVEQEGRG